MEFLKQVFSPKGENSVYSVVDVYNKKKFFASKYLDFLGNIGKAKNHLAEIPLFPCSVVVDFDRKEKGNDIKSLYEPEEIVDVCNQYVDVLKNDFGVPDDDLACLVFTKKPRISNGYLKHGFHLQFPFVAMDKVNGIRLFKRVAKGFQDRKEILDCLDNVVGKPWLLYGSTKSPNEPFFQITGSIENGEFSDEWRHVLIGTHFNGVEITERNLNTSLVKLLSLRNNKMFEEQTVYECNNEIVMEEDMNNKFLFLNQPKTAVINISSEKIGELVTKLSANRADSYSDWIKVGMILAGQAHASPNDYDYFKSVFHIFSRQSDKYNDVECEERFKSLYNSKNCSMIGIGTLVYMAKEDDVFKDISDFLFNYNVEKIPVNDYDIAKMIKETITERYITHKDHGCYVFRDTIWTEVFGWENVFKLHIESWSGTYIRNMRQKVEQRSRNLNAEDPDYANDVIVSKMLEKSLGTLIKKTANYSSLNNIVKSLFDLYFDENLRTIFVPNERYLPFNNCVFDVEEWRIVPPNPKHYLSQKINHDLEDWENVDEDHKNFVVDFFEKIFPDDELREYCLNNFSRLLTGKNSHKQFQFWTGIGNNGKSVCISMMEKVFGGMAMKMPKSLVMGGTTSKGGATPEIYRLKDARLAIIDEVTNNDYLDPGQLKGLSGNDTIYGRDLYQKGKDVTEIQPLFLPIIITNETPIIKKPDDATWNRIRLIRFESVFKNNVEEYIRKNPGVDVTKVFKCDPQITDKLKVHAKYFLSLFMHRLLQHESIEEFNYEEIIPEKVHEGLQNFKHGQNIMRQFLEENFIVDPTSTEVYSLKKLLKEYNSSKPKVILNEEEVKAAIQSYALSHPGLVLQEHIIKGLCRVTF